MTTSTVSSLKSINLPPAAPQIRRRQVGREGSVVSKSADKMSVSDPAFQPFVDKLKTAKLRGEESVRDAVRIIKSYQKKYGDSEKELARLAKAVGVTTRTCYRWMAQVGGKKPEAKKQPPKNIDPGQRYRSLLRAVDSIYGQVATTEREAEINRHAQQLIQDRGNPAEFVVKTEASRADAN